nr:MAG TPA: hypothetical protein [Caudoviricetes sp.]
MYKEVTRTCTCQTVKYDNIGEFGICTAVLSWSELFVLHTTYSSFIDKLKIDRSLFPADF